MDYDDEFNGRDAESVPHGFDPLEGAGYDDGGLPPSTECASPHGSDVLLGEGKKADPKKEAVKVIMEYFHNMSADEWKYLPDEVKEAVTVYNKKKTRSSTFTKIFGDTPAIGMQVTDMRAAEALEWEYGVPAIIRMIPKWAEKGNIVTHDSIEKTFTVKEIKG